MNKFEYLKENREYQYGKVHNGYKLIEKEGGLLTKPKKEKVKVFVYEDEWLNEMGSSGWELVSVHAPILDLPREYYFKRLK